MGGDIPIYLSMEMWPRHIKKFEWQYKKAFSKDPLFGAGLIESIHKWVQVFLKFCNTTSIEDMESGSLEEFGELKNKVEKGGWLTTMPG